MNVDRSDQISDSSPAPAIAEVTVQGPGISITRPVDESTMSSIIALLFGAAPAYSGGIRGGGPDGPPHPGSRGPSSTTQQPPTGWEEDLTMGEFLVETDAKTFPQKISAAGYYLINFLGAESFTRDDVKAALTNAHEDMPGNFARDWNNAASSHLIAAKQGEAGQFYVPRTGRTAVESHFQDAPKRRNTRRTTKKTSSASSNGDPE